jgi:hypothetical protein
MAQKVYGVALNASGDQVDEAETARLRKQMRAERLASAKPVIPGGVRGKLSSNARPVMRVHECLDIVADGDNFTVCCRSCNQDLGAATGNYKNATVSRAVPKDQLTELPPPAGRTSLGAYVEYFCPGCATLLDVEVACPSVEGEKLEPVWDIAVSDHALRHAASDAGKVPVAAE